MSFFNLCFESYIIFSSAGIPAAPELTPGQTSFANFSPTFQHPVSCRSSCLSNCWARLFVAFSTVVVIVLVVVAMVVVVVVGS